MPPAQIALDLPSVTAAGQPWWQLPEASRVQVLTLLSRLIARGVLATDGQWPGPDPTGPQGGLRTEEGRD